MHSFMVRILNMNSSIYSNQLQVSTSKYNTYNYRSTHFRKKPAWIASVAKQLVADYKVLAQDWT